jgi:hypothetical protein
MEQHSRLLAVVVALLLALSPVSAGCPHNQGWLHGSGDSDLDDVASLVGAGFVDAFLLCRTCRPPVSAFLWPNGDSAASSHSPSASPTRGPPTV